MTILHPFKRPILLLLSYPRSGSSWIGEILSKSESVAYLREPITQPYLRARGGKYTLADIDNNPLAYSIYKELSDLVFQGVPPQDPDIINNIHDFSRDQRQTRYLLIKEVNPKATGFYCQRYHPKLLLLLRHPAAVALSFASLGWLDSLDTQLDTGDPNANRWEKFGHAYGSTIQYALDIIQNCCDHEIILYENLVLDPENQFRQLFQSLNLDIPKNYKEIIRDYCYSQEPVEDSYQTRRMSKNIAHEWREKLSNQEIASIRKGFMLSDMKFYSNDADWVSAQKTGAERQK